MKRNFIFSLVLIITLSSIAISYFSIEKNDKRAIQEAFIIKSAQKAKSIQKYVDKDIKAADQPDMAAFQEFISTMDPSLGYVPEKRLLKAYKKTVLLMNEQNSNREYELIINWQSTSANMGGRTRALMFDPDDSNNKLWAGGVTGGLWKISDISSSTAQWEAVSDFWPNLAISCITYDPNNTEIMYVGTGEAQTARIIYRKSSGLGAGIFRTIDGGDTWELIPSTEDFAYVTDIVVRNENGSSVIYAAVVSGTYMGEDHNSQPSDGLYRSNDNGVSWEQVLPNIIGISEDKPYAPSDIDIAADGKIFVGTMENLNKEGGATVLFSETGLEGSWSIYDNFNNIISGENTYKIPARTIIAVAPSNSDVVYAQFAAGYQNGTFTYYRGCYMAKSIDGGQTWNQMNSPSTDGWATLAWHAFILKVDPSDENSIFTGGLDLWKSSNSGNSWNHISDWSLMYYGGGDEYVHADQHNIQFMNNVDNKAAFSSDGGVFFSQSTNLSYPIFEQRNKGYNTLQFYSGAMHPDAGVNKFLGGLQDNGSLLYDGTPLDIDDMTSGGDGAMSFWDKNDPDVLITSVYYNKYYSWDSNGDQIGYEDGNSGTFVSPADYDYKMNTIYSNGVQFSGNYANKISRITGVPNNMQQQLVNIGTSSNVPFSHVKYSEFSDIGSTTLFVGTQSGKLYKVENANTSPSSTEIGSDDFPAANLSCVAIGNSEDTLLVTFSNYGVSSIWQTYNGGQSWTEKEGNLPDMPIRWAIYHPENNGQALIATETGVWATNTLKEENTVWAPAITNMANVRVDMLTFRESDNNVLAATHGRGLFWAEYNADLYTGINNNFASEINIRIYPNPTSDIINFDVTDEIINITSLKIINLEGQLIRNFTSINNNSSLNISDLKSGSYVAIINLEGGLVSKQTIIVK
jgi:hypothetical protein